MKWSGTLVGKFESLRDNLGVADLNLTTKIYQLKQNMLNYQPLIRNSCMKGAYASRLEP